MAEDTVEYWKQQAQEAKADLDEFVEGSKDLEESLEAELEIKERENAEMLAKMAKLTDGLDDLRSRSASAGKELSTAQSALSKAESALADTKRRCVKLEQRNDELESSERISSATIEDMQTKLDEAIEQNVYLQNDLDEVSEISQAELRRALEEKNDLQSELVARTARDARLATEAAESAVSAEDFEALKLQIQELEEELADESERCVALSKEVTDLTDELMERPSVSVDKEELEKLRTSNARLTHELETVQTSYATKVASEKEESAKTIQKLQSEVVAAVSDAEASRNLTAEATMRAEDTEQRAKKQKEESDAAHEEMLAQLDSKIKNAATAHENHQEQLERSASELESRTQECNDLRMLLESAENKVASLEKASSEKVSAAIAAVVLERDALRSSLKAAEATMKTTDSETGANGKKREVTAVTAAANNVEEIMHTEKEAAVIAELAATKHQCNLLEAERDKLVASLKMVETAAFAATSSAEEAARLSAELDAANKRCSELHASIEVARKEAIVMPSEVSPLNSELQQLHSAELNNVTKERDKLLILLEKAKEAEEAAKLSLDTTDNEQATMISTNPSQECTELIKELNTAKATSSTYESENSELKTRLDATMAERDNLQSAMKSLQTNFTLATEARAACEKELSIARNALQAAEALAQTVESRVGAATSDHRLAAESFAEASSASSAARVAALRFAYSAQLKANSALLSRVQSMSGNILVCCRIRPFTSAELARRSIEDESTDNSEQVPGGRNAVVEALSSSEVSFYHSRQHAWRPFAFDRVFPPTEAQDDVRREMLDLRIAESVVGGAHCCVMAYGQTGSGKTYTMEGPEGAPGVNEALLNQLFSLTNALGGKTRFDVRVAVLEIYNESVRDLLVKRVFAPASGDLGGGGSKHSPSSKALTRLTRVKVGGEGGISGLCWEPVYSSAEVKVVLAKGRENRATASTEMNAESSRSHSIVIVQVRQFDNDDNTADRGGGHVKAGDHNPAYENGVAGRDGSVSTLGQLYLVDLAGSERVHKSSVSGARLEEAKNINRSLSALGDVLEALDSKRSHVPYRNSKLTMLLQPSLSANARCVMLLTVPPSPNTAGETHNSLQFASRARNINLGPTVAKCAYRNGRAATRKLQDSLRVAVASKSAAEASLVTVRRELATARKRLGAANMRSSQSETRKITALEERLRIQVAENAKLTNRLESSAEQRAEADASAVRMKNEVSRSKDQHAQLKREAMDLKRRCEVLEKELRRLRHVAATATTAAEGKTRHRSPSKLSRMLQMATPLRRSSSKSHVLAAPSHGASSTSPNHTAGAIVESMPKSADTNPVEVVEMTPKSSPRALKSAATVDSRKSRIPKPNSLSPSTVVSPEAISAEPPTAPPARKGARATRIPGFSRKKPAVPNSAGPSRSPPIRVTRAAAAAQKHADRLRRHYNLRSSKRK